MAQPRSGRYRVACNTPGELVWVDRRREGRVWNLSVGGAYVVLPASSIPLVGEEALLRFLVPGHNVPITCQVRVQWVNAQSAARRCGFTQPALPPGCGLSFVAMRSDDAARVGVAVAAAFGRPTAWSTSN